MTQGSPPISDAEQTLAWRDRMSLYLLRAFLVTFIVGGAIIGTGMHGDGRVVLVAIAGTSALVLAYPAITGRPGGALRSWLTVIPGLTGAVAGYGFVGYLSGPAVLLAVMLMLAGLLLGHKALIALTAASALSVTVIAWAMVSGHIPAPDPRDIAMTSGSGWARSLTVTFIAIGFFAGMTVAVVARIERALALAGRETLRREHAERARAEAELVALEAKQLETVGRLAAGVAHDFNNNLTAILGSAELLKLELEPGDTKHILADGIVQASNRAAELTRQLLAYSRKAQMLQTPTDLHRTINEAVWLLRRSVDPRVRIVTDLGTKSPTVMADAALLQSALLNLFVNACDAMPGGGTLSVSTTLLEKGLAPPLNGKPTTSAVLLEVLDTGSGIPKELLSDIFNPFFTTKPVGRGTGLGLAAVAGTIRAHGGAIEVESDVGVGSAFRIYLPTTDDDAPTIPTTTSAIIRGAGEILLVEDDAMVSRTAIATLSSFGYQVTRVPDGASAVEMVRAEPKRFGLVLLDLRMPGMTGEATFDALRWLEPRLRVLIWSGYGAEQDVSAMLQRGAVGFVQKPYRVGELSHLIADALRRPD